MLRFSRFPLVIFGWIIGLCLNAHAQEYSPMEKALLAEAAVVLQVPDNFDKQQVMQAYTALKNVLELNPNNATAIYNIEVCHIRMGLQPNCHRMNEAVRLGYEVAKQEMFFYVCIKKEPQPSK